MNIQSGSYYWLRVQLPDRITVRLSTVKQSSTGSWFTTFIEACPSIVYNLPIWSELVMYTLMTLRCTESYFSCLFNLQLLLLCLRICKKVGSTYKWYNLSVGGKQKHKPSFDGKAPISWAKTGHPDACAEGGRKKQRKEKKSDISLQIVLLRPVFWHTLTFFQLNPRQSWIRSYVYEKAKWQ